MENNGFVDKFTQVAVKIGSQVHLCSLRDAFALTMPLFILAGLAVLINFVVLDWIFTGETLATAQQWGNIITNGTLNISGLLIAPMIAYSLSRNKKFKNAISSALVAISALIMMMPLFINITPVDLTDAVTISGALSFGDLGTKGMFAGIIIGLLATEVYMRLSRIKRLQIHLGENVPEAVGNSFSAMIPIILTLVMFALVSFTLAVVLNTNLIELVSTLIQEPLRMINTSLAGTVIIYSIGNFLFSLGIHQSVINGTILDPLLLVNMNENMLAFAAGQPIPHIINSVFVPTFGMIGGTGSTICLIIATLIFGKNRSSKDIVRISTAPGIFNINEPIIFGFPIVFNIPMMIPFVLLPAMGIIFAYFMTAIGFISPVVVMIPWTTPPFLSAYLATAGDWRAVIVQAIIIVAGIFLYLPFMRVSERVAISGGTKVAEE